MTNSSREFRDLTIRYWQDKTKALRLELDNAEWEGADLDKLATLRQALTNAKRCLDKSLTNEVTNG